MRGPARGYLVNYWSLFQITRAHVPWGSVHPWSSLLVEGVGWGRDAEPNMPPSSQGMCFCKRFSCFSLWNFTFNFSQLTVSAVMPGKSLRRLMFGFIVVCTVNLPRVLQWKMASHWTARKRNIHIWENLKNTILYFTALALWHFVVCRQKLPEIENMTHNLKPKLCRGKS